MPKKEISKGTYSLLIDLKDDAQIKVGKLGPVNFKKGYYVYVGSALNSLEGRINRHRREDKKLFWHIDYLLDHEKTEIIDIVYTVSDVKWECKLAAAIGKYGVEIGDFGCSDCKCQAHLFYFEELINLKDTVNNSFKSLNLSPETFKSNL